MAYIGKGFTTLTPSLLFGGANVGMTTSTNQLLYTRLGNLVFFRCNITLTAKGSSTGLATISNSSMPVPISGNTSCTCFLGNVTFANNYVIASARNNTIFEIIFQDINVAGAGANLFDTNFSDTSIININGWYYGV